MYIIYIAKNSSISWYTYKQERMYIEIRINNTNIQVLLCVSQHESVCEMCRGSAHAQIQLAP